MGGSAVLLSLAKSSFAPSFTMTLTMTSIVIVRFHGNLLLDRVRGTLPLSAPNSAADEKLSARHLFTTAQVSCQPHTISLTSFKNKKKDKCVCVCVCVCVCFVHS